MVGEPTVGSDPYVVNTVQRDTIYVFKRGLLVFELADPSGNVYVVMQSYSQQIRPLRCRYERLPDIGPRDLLAGGLEPRCAQAHART